MSRLAEVEALLGRYFDALYESDASALGNVMHPRAIYATPDEQPLLYRTMDEYLPTVAARQPPASRGDVRRDSVDSIEFAGDDCAMARVRCSMGQRDFFDLLSLVRTEGEWRIIAKIFHFTDRN